MNIIGQIDPKQLKGNIIGQIEREDTLTLFIEVDKYYLYEVRFVWHKDKQWMIKGVELVCSLDHHVGLCCEKQDK